MCGEREREDEHWVIVWGVTEFWEGVRLLGERMRVWGREKEVKYVWRDGDSVDCVGRERWCEGRVCWEGEHVGRKGCGEKERLWMCHERESVGLEYVWSGCACGGGGGRSVCEE